MAAQSTLYPKYKVTGTHKVEVTEFGPFDTEEKAKSSVAPLAKAGLEGAEVKVIFTCSSVAVFLRDNAPVEEPKAEDAPAEETPAEPEAKPEPPKATSRGRNGRSGRNNG